MNSVTGDERAARCVVIGDAETAGLLVRQLELLPDGPRVRRVLVVGKDDIAAGLNEEHAPAGEPGVGGGVDVAYVSLPAWARVETQEVRGLLRARGIRERFVPPLMELLSREPGGIPTGAPGGGDLVELEKLIGREPRPVDRGLIGAMVRGRSVLVTGAGGSIGTELVRACAGYGPSEIVLMDRSENALFEIDRWMGARHPGIARRAILHDVTDEARTAGHLSEIRPAVVLHAAAHKHVPLMEDHPADALKNNLMGTRSIIEAAAAAGAERFVLISSDKAVNPSSVMGATKRMAEMYCQGVREREARAGVSGGVSRGVSGGGMLVSMVRFGNVLGSNGSVLRIWADQVREGGPVTVTDRRMSRYFMTIPEAASLVLQAAALAGGVERDTPGPVEIEGVGGAEVFVLDMGEPLLIWQLAERFVRGFGLRPVDGGTRAVPPGQGLDPATGEIDLIETGARPGEKLHEELAYAEEQLGPTRHPAVRVLRRPGRVDARQAEAMVREAEGAIRSGSRDEVRRVIGRWVSEARMEGGGRHAA